MGSGIFDIFVYFSFTGGDLFRLSHCRRSVLLVCKDCYTKVLCYSILDYRLAYSRWELDSHDFHLFLWRSINFVGHLTLERGLRA